MKAELLALIAVRPKELKNMIAVDESVFDKPYNGRNVGRGINLTSISYLVVSCSEDVSFDVDPKLPSEHTVDSRSSSGAAAAFTSSVTMSTSS